MKRFLVSLLLVLLIVSPTRAAPLDSVPASGKLSFAIWREGNRIGSHRMTFRREGTTVTVEVRVDIVGAGRLDHAVPVYGAAYRDVA